MLILDYRTGRIHKYNEMKHGFMAPELYIWVEECDIETLVGTYQYRYQNKEKQVLDWNFDIRSPEFESVDFEIIRNDFLKSHNFQGELIRKVLYLSKELIAEHMDD